MKNFWFKRISGQIKVKVIGIGVERLLNYLIKNNVVIWNVHRIDDKTVVFYMFIADLSHLRKAVHHHRVKVRFIKRAGLPFFLVKLRKNLGFLTGALIALLLTIVLSNMIWKIDVNGASPELEYRIIQQLKDMGVKVGGFQWFVDDPEGIQKKLTSLNEDVTWIGVELNGTTYRFQVVEKEQPERPKEAGPRHLVAKKEAVIVDYFVEKGEPVITINEFVKPGQLLVSGLIGKEDHPKLVSATGKVCGKTWYNTTVEVQLTSEFELLTGRETHQTRMNIGNFSFAIWGFHREQFKHTQTELDEKTINIFKWTLPISFTNMTIKEVEIHKKSYTKKEAKDLALDMARKNIKEHISSDAEITDEKILHEQIENGKLKLTVSYDVIENIAKEVPIIQN